MWRPSIAVPKPGQRPGTTSRRDARAGACDSKPRHYPRTSLLALQSKRRNDGVARPPLASMSETKPEIENPMPVAWQPLTPGGVAAFASGSTNRLRVMQVCFAALASLCVIWFLNRTCAPVILEAVQNLPDTAEISGGQLRGAQPTALAARRFLSLSVDFEQSGSFGRESTVQFEFSTNRFQVCSLLGCLGFSYPKDWNLDLGRPIIEPKFGAWKPYLLALAGLGAFLGLLLSWTVLACLYAAPAKMIACFNDRSLTWSGSWRLAGAALMPGAMMLSIGILLFGAGTIDLVRFGLLFAAHFVVGWIYLVAAPFRLPLVPDQPLVKKNPFDGEPVTPGESVATTSKPGEEPKPASKPPESAGKIPAGENPFGTTLSKARDKDDSRGSKENPFA